MIIAIIIIENSKKNLTKSKSGNLAKFKITTKNGAMKIGLSFLISIAKKAFN